MPKTITKLNIDESNKQISWVSNGTIVIKAFGGEIFAYLIDELDEVLVLADSTFDGPNNLFIYNGDGSERLNPVMPALKKPVDGVYAIWFVKGLMKQEVILLSEEYSPYNTGCTFDLKAGVFSNFHPSK